MPWDKDQKGYRSLTVRERDEETIVAKIEEFWRLFAADSLGEVDAFLWDYLFIDVRGVDERFGVYPQKLASPPFMVSWASLAIRQMGCDFEEVVETDPDGSKIAKLNTHYANMMIEAARRVDLAKLVGWNEGVFLRFVSYAEDNPLPFLEERIMPG